MHFREWLLINENIEINLDRWIGDIVRYARPEERRVLDSLARNTHITLDPPSMAKPYRDSTISVLREKRLENPNWLAFSLGYLSAKKYRTEDLEMAVDVARRLIASGELPKSRIGEKGWLLTGRDVYPKVQEYLAASQRISNRAERKMKKRGETGDDDERLIRLVAQEGDLKLYHLHSMGQGTKYGLPKDDEEIKARHRILCKYGKGTGWCTATPTGDFHQIYLKNNIYIVHDAGKPVYQFVGCEDEKNHQFMDASDNAVRDLDARTFSFLKRNAEIGCHKISVKFEDLDEYKSADVAAKDAISHESVYELLKAGNPMEVVRALGENGVKIVEGLLSNNLIAASDIVHDAFHRGGREFADWVADALSRQDPGSISDPHAIRGRLTRVFANILDFCLDKGDALGKIAPIVNRLGIGNPMFFGMNAGRPGTRLPRSRNSGELLELFLKAGVDVGTLNKLKHSSDPMDMAVRMGAEVNKLDIEEIRELMRSLEDEQVGPMQEILLGHIEGLVNRHVSLVYGPGWKPDPYDAVHSLGQVLWSIGIEKDDRDRISKAAFASAKENQGLPPGEIRKLIDDARNRTPAVEDD